MNRVFGLYVVLTDPPAGYHTCAEAAVAEEVAFLQLRMKDVSCDEFIRTAQDLRSITKGSKTLFIVNDDVQVAMAVDADGLHLGQEDMTPVEAGRIWGDESKIIGYSTHSPEQAAAAKDERPHYIGVGPVFPTPTKKEPDPDLGLEMMGRIIRGTTLPAVAIGGINKDNLTRVLDAGAINFACVRPVTQSRNPRGEIRMLMDIWQEWREKNL